MASEKLIAALDAAFAAFHEGLPEAQLMFVEAANQNARQSAARNAGVPFPSAETWELVVAEYRKRVQRAEVSRCVAGALKSAGAR